MAPPSNRRPHGVRRWSLTFIAGLLVTAAPTTAASGVLAERDSGLSARRDEPAHEIQLTDAGSPPGPSRLRARSDESDVILTWEPPRAAEGPSPSDYRVEVVREGEVILTEIVDGREFVHKDAAPGRLHHYAVVARYGGAREAEPFDIGPLAFFPPPEHLRVEVDGDTVTLSWDPPSDLPEGTTVGYDVFRGGPGSLTEEPEPLARFARDEAAGEFSGGIRDTEFVDTGLEPGTYVYAVQAVYLDEKYQELWRSDDGTVRPPPSDGPSVRATVEEPPQGGRDDATQADSVTLDRRWTPVGGGFVVTGRDCPAGEEVTVTADGADVATGVAEEDGRFSLEATAPSSPGVTDVEVACGGVERMVALTVVRTTSTGGTSSAVVGTVLAFLVLIVALLWPRRPVWNAPDNRLPSTRPR